MGCPIGCTVQASSSAGKRLLLVLAVKLFLAIIQVHLSAVYPHMGDVVRDVIHDITVRDDYRGFLANIKGADFVINTENLSD